MSTSITLYWKLLKVAVETTFPPNKRGRPLKATFDETFECIAEVVRSSSTTARSRVRSVSMCPSSINVYSNNLLYVDSPSSFARSSRRSGVRVDTMIYEMEKAMAAHVSVFTKPTEACATCCRPFDIEMSWHASTCYWLHPPPSGASIGLLISLVRADTSATH